VLALKLPACSAGRVLAEGVIAGHRRGQKVRVRISENELGMEGTYRGINGADSFHGHPCRFFLAGVVAGGNWRGQAQKTNSATHSPGH